MSSQPHSDIRFQTIPGAAEAELRQQVQVLASKAQAEDGNPPLSDQTFIELASAGGEQGLLGAYAHRASDDGELLGTAIAFRADQQDAWTVELVVHPAHRRCGIATGLLEELGRLLELSAVQCWAHGGHPGAAVLAQKHALERYRDLYKMRRSSPEQLPVGTLPEHLQLRTFEVGRDEQAWLRANAAAFAEHPEQGGMALEDLQARIAEPWFDASGFFLAVDADSEIKAFHWTKLPRPDAPDSALIGEVYAVGVVPGAQGLGLGRTLTAVGINHLLQRGVEAVMLYVDADNIAAVRLYESLGFTVSDVDVMYGPAR